MKNVTILISILAVTTANSFGQGHWRLGGNPAFPPPDGVNATNNILGTNAGVNFPLRIHTNGTQRMHIANGGVTNGFVGIGSGFNAPVSLLHINSLNNGTGEVFRTTAPAGVDHTWRMNTVFDAFRFYIQNPANTVEARLVNEVDGEINFFTNFAGSGGARSMSIQGGIGNVVHGQVAFGNALPVNFNAQSRLHLHQTTIAPNPNPGANFIQFTNSNTTGNDAPGPNTGFQIGIVNPGDAYVRQNENAPIRFTTGGPFVQRMIILGNVGGTDEGYIGMNTVNPTSRLDINGNVRVRDVQQVPANALLLGVQHTPGTLEDLDVRRLDFNGQSGFYLGGNGQWVALPSPTGIVPENGLSFQTGSGTNVEFGQNVNAAGDPAALQNDREVPMNDFNITFIDDGSINGNQNRIGIGYEFPVARVDVRTHPTSHGSPTALRLVNSTTASDNLAYGTRILVNGVNNNDNLGIDIEVQQGLSTNTGVRVSALSTSPGTSANRGGTFIAANGGTNHGVGGRAETTAGTPASFNIGVQGQAENGVQNIGGEFKAGGGAMSYNYGIRTFALGNAGTNIGIDSRVDNPGNPNNFAGYFVGSVYVDGNLSYSGALIPPSDQLFKNNVSDLTGAVDLINQLQPRTYFFDTLGYSQFNFEADQQMGLIAQEVEVVLPAIVGTSLRPAEYDSLGNITVASFSYKNIEYTELIPLLVAGMKEQQAMIDSLASELSYMQNCLNNAGICNTNFHAPQQNSQEEQLRAANSIDVQLRNGESIVLNQNVPNPFAEKTVITYFIPESIGKAQIHFYNNEGKLINSVEIREPGNGQINVFADDLSTGVYTYSLIADGRFISTKRMVKE